jgi:signal peptidase II
MSNDVANRAEEPFWTPARVAMPVLVALAVGVTDQVAKGVVSATLELREGASVAGLFSLHHFRNPGIGGGDLAGNALPLALAGIVAVLAITVFMLNHDLLRWPGLLGFGLLFGGGLSNLVDRLRDGYVTDYLVRDGSAYNVADVAIFTGGLIVLGVLIVSLTRSHEQASAASETSSG